MIGPEFRPFTIEFLPGLQAEFESDWPMVGERLLALPEAAARSAGAANLARVRLRTDSAVPVKTDFTTACAVEWHAFGQSRYALSVHGFEGTLDTSTPTLRLDLRVHPDAPRWAATLLLRDVAMLALARHGYLLIHASCLVIDGRAVLCLGHSTAGKTTTARRAGRAGAMRIADDMLVLRRGETLSVRPFVTDRAARLPGRLDRWWDLHRAYFIAKGAPTMRVAPLSNPLATWCEAIMSASLTRDDARFALDTALDLCERVPLRRFEVAPSGDVLGPLRANLET